MTSEILNLLNQLYPNLEDIVFYQGNFYKRNSFWYDLMVIEHEINKIANYLLAEGKTPSLAKTILKNLELLTIVSHHKCNPPGYFPFKNGVLRWHWEDKKLKSVFVPADLAKELDVIFLGTPLFDFDPHSNDKELNSLLQCLDEPYREILIRSVACALDLPAVRRFHSRIPRALLLYGTGSNGKDALRSIFFRLFGTSCSAISLADFQSYDSGRKFGIADLELAKINWSSENAQLKKIDTIESIKLVVSGDPISIERKGIQEYRVVPQTVLFFNTNAVPKILASSPAIKTRYAIIPFTKTYTANPDPAKGELLADPRFKDDPQFIDREILPALFNLLLTKLQEVAVQGIDYTATVNQLEQARADSSHLVRFCEDVGLVEDPDGIVLLNEVWECLENWYIAEGFLTIEIGARGGKKKLWEHGADKCVQASHQLFHRLQELFPNIKRKTMRFHDENGAEHKRVSIQGLAFTEKTGFQDFQGFQTPDLSGFQETQQGFTRVPVRVPSPNQVEASHSQVEALRNPNCTENTIQGSMPETSAETAIDDENAVQRKPWNPIYQVGKVSFNPGDKVVYKGTVPWIKEMFGDKPAVVVSYVNGCLYLSNPVGGLDVPVLDDGWELVQ